MWRNSSQYDEDPINSEGHAPDYCLRVMVLSIFACIFAMMVWFNISALAFPYINLDEQAHYSYAHDLMIHTHSWPDFNHFYMYQADGALSQERNYLNHPPQFYWFTNLLQLHTAQQLRLFAFTCSLMMIFLYAVFGIFITRSIAETLLYSMLPFLLFVPFMLGFYNNDLAALLGGFLCCLGTYRLGEQKHIRQAWVVILFGFLLASVKFTSFLLVGLYLLFFMRSALIKQQMRFTHYVCLSIVAILGSMPYGYFLWQWGSPVPETIGEIDFLKHTAALMEWTDLPRMSFFQWIFYGLSRFSHLFNEWYDHITVLPLLSLLVVWGGFLRTMWLRREQPLEMMTRAACFSTLLVLSVHLVFSYQSYLRYGTFGYFYIRYYLPLLPVYGLTIIHGYRQLRCKYKMWRN